MSEVLIIIRGHIPMNRLREMKREAAENRHPSSNVMGFQGFTAWESVTFTGQTIAIFEYLDLESAERGFEEFVSSNPAAMEDTPFDSPENILTMTVSRRLGKHFVTAPEVSYLSFSHRIAEPGFDDALLVDTEMIVENLATMPGFLSATYGPNATLAEEICCLAAWESKEAFEASLPPRTPDYSVDVFRRFA